MNPTNNILTIILLWSEACPEWTEGQLLAHIVPINYLIAERMDATSKQPYEDPVFLRNARDPESTFFDIADLICDLLCKDVLYFSSNGDDPVEVENAMRALVVETKRFNYFVRKCLQFIDRQGIPIDDVSKQSDSTSLNPNLFSIINKSKITTSDIEALRIRITAIANLFTCIQCAPIVESSNTIFRHFDNLDKRASIEKLKYALIGEFGTEENDKNDKSLFATFALSFARAFEVSSFAVQNAIIPLDDKYFNPAKPGVAASYYTHFRNDKIPEARIRDFLKRHGLNYSSKNTATENALSMCSYMLPLLIESSTYEFTLTGNNKNGDEQNISRNFNPLKAAIEHPSFESKIQSVWSEMYSYLETHGNNSWAKNAEIRLKNLIDYSLKASNYDKSETYETCNIAMCRLRCIAFLANISLGENFAKDALKIQRDLSDTPTPSMTSTQIKNNSSVLDDSADSYLLLRRKAFGGAIVEDIILEAFAKTCVLAIKGKRISSNQATIGVASDCDIILESDHISRHHATIEHSSKNTWLLNDLQSTNGTILVRNSSPLQIDDPDTPIELKSGDKIMFGTGWKGGALPSPSEWMEVIDCK